MLRVREIVEELKVFERNKVPFEVKVLGIATYKTSSLGRTARILSELHPVSIDLSLEQEMFEERLPLCIREEYLNSIGRKSC
ncbi:hypothetical protein AIOGIFDO_01443 [Candidatus Methanoperedenaceae archaeon GB37]|nr:hypothetical protein AIOGIFDO_01443 [Candidatus Methanoperedenaceae archaeon GB37]